MSGYLKYIFLIKLTDFKVAYLFRTGKLFNILQKEIHLCESHVYFSMKRSLFCINDIFKNN